MDGSVAKWLVDGGEAWVGQRREIRGPEATGEGEVPTGVPVADINAMSEGPGIWPRCVFHSRRHIFAKCNV
jgi:hypothetical protein